MLCLFYCLQIIAVSRVCSSFIRSFIHLSFIKTLILRLLCVFLAQVKGDVWKAVAAGLVTAGGSKATVEGVSLVTASGPIALPSDIPDGSSIR